MIDVLEILPHGSFDDEAELDQVVLDHDHRLRRRIVLITEKAQSVRLNQVKPVQLRDGDGLKLSTGDIVLVRAAPEALLEITAHNLAELVRIAWHLGNRHLPTQLAGDKLLIRADHVIADMVHGLGGHTQPILAAFDPEGGAYAAQIGHDHGHAHDHGHGAHHHHD
jgi:urease accessory protein